MVFKRNLSLKILKKGFMSTFLIGSYMLLIHLSRDKKINVGKLGSIFFKKGMYLYVGSAMTSLCGRINYHHKKMKKPHWHIDYLLNEARILGAFLFPSDRKIECLIASHLTEKFLYMPRFGSSDCRCKSHLFFHQSQI